MMRQSGSLHVMDYLPVVADVVLHTGPRTFLLGERLVAAPISALWAAARGGHP